MMPGSKRSKLYYTLLIVILAGVYNLLLFALKRTFEPASWVAYAFTMLGFTILVIVGTVPKEKYAGFPMFGIPMHLRTVSYFAAQLVLGILIYCISGFNFTAAWLLEILLLLGYLGSLAFKLMVRQTVSDHEARIKRKVFYMKAMQAELEGLRNDIADPALKGRLEALIEQVQYSDPMSHDTLEKIEQWIQMDVEALRDDVAENKLEQAGERIAAVSKRLEERNARCKLLK